MNLEWKYKMLVKKTMMVLLSKATLLVNDKTYTTLMYRIIFGRNIDFDAPVTYNEYLSALKIKSDPEEYKEYADKYETRQYIAQTVGTQYLNPVVGLYDCFDDIDFDSLPNSFVMKCTHGSSYNMIVHDKNTFNRLLAKKKFDRWLRQNYYYPMRERQYKNIRPRIMCDVYLSPADGSPLNEVKLYCINGTVRFIMDNHESKNARYSNIYTREWGRLPVTYGFPNSAEYGVPANASELVYIAEQLAAPFEFVRVDLFNIDGKIIFCELTFCPAGGMTPFVPDSFDYEMGQYFNSKG